MAFFLPFIGEIGVLVAAELAELGVAAPIAGAVGGFIGNEVKSQTNKAFTNGLDALANKVLGEDRKNEIENSISALPGEVMSIFQSPKEFAARKLEEQKKAQARQDAIDRELAHDTSGRDVTTHNDSDGCACEEVVYGIPVLDDTSRGATDDTSRGVTDGTYATSDSTNPNLGSLIADLVVTHASELAEAGVQDHLDDVIPMGVIVEEPTSNHLEVLEEVIADDPDRYTLLQKLSNFYADKSLSKSEEFKEIYSKYTGKGFDPRNVVMSETPSEYLFFLYDEIGDLITLRQKKDAKTIPPVYGVFGGPSSPNNQLPIDTPDTCFMAHDADYSKSYFHWESDMRLVSRLTQRRASWPQDKVTQLNSIVIYFATIGASVAVIKGSITGDPSKEVITDDVTDDLFPAMVPEALNLPKQEYLTERYNFYKQFSEGVKEAESESKVFSTGGKRIRNLFEAMKIELL